MKKSRNLRKSNRWLEHMRARTKAKKPLNKWESSGLLKDILICSWAHELNRSMVGGIYSYR